MDDAIQPYRTATPGRERLFETIFANAGEGIMITDADGTVVEVNERFTRITGYAREEIVGRNPRVLQSGRQAPAFYTAMWRALLENGSWHGEIWNRRKNGEVFAEMSTITAVRDAAGRITHYIAQFTDITIQKEQQRRLERLAHYDTLTGLPNRSLLVDRLRQAMARCQGDGKPLAIGYVDLDGMKSINDAYGHVAGDEMLIACAHHMKRVLREGDTLARVGSDEFVLVLAGLSRADDCEPLLTRLLDAAAEPLRVDGREARVTASIGVTFYPQDGADADQLIRQADQAMTLAKQAGKARWHLFDLDQDQSMKSRRRELARLREALEQGEFELYYQPKVNMRTGSALNAEALIRWNHPERGLLAPGQFLPLMENDPLSAEVGEWVIAKALAQMAGWHAEGLPLSVSVNIGAVQLQADDFVERLRELLAAQPLPRFALELEVLETSELADLGEVAATMRACQALGVGFALDDFGTGYSSLTYLKHLPASLLKIDQSFVRDMRADVGSLAIVEAVIGLGRAFRRNVIAEGVETAAHGRALLQLGCEWGQGYAIARPMPAAALPGWVAAWRPDPSWSAPPAA